MENYKITEEIIKNAKVLNLSEIYEAAVMGAMFTVIDTEDGVAIADTYKREMFVTHILVNKCLKLVDMADGEIIDEDTYNDMMMSNIYGMLKRTFKDKDVENKRKLVIGRFNKFKEMLEAEIKNELMRKNDLLTRINKAIDSSITPELMEKIGQIKEITEETKGVNDVG